MYASHGKKGLTGGYIIVTSQQLVFSISHLHLHRYQFPLPHLLLLLLLRLRMRSVLPSATSSSVVQLTDRERIPTLADAWIPRAVEVLEIP